MREWHAQQTSSWVPVHATDVLNSLERDVFPYIGSTPVAAETSSMVLQLVRRIEERPSVENARGVRQRISAVYGSATASGYATSDPAVSIRGAMKPLIKKRQPALGPLEDARALLMAAKASGAHPMIKLASRLLALTAMLVTGYPGDTAVRECAADVVRLQRIALAIIKRERDWEKAGRPCRDKMSLIRLLDLEGAYDLGVFRACCAPVT